LTLEQTIFDPNLLENTLCVEDGLFQASKKTSLVNLLYGAQERNLINGHQVGGYISSLSNPINLEKYEGLSLDKMFSGDRSLSYWVMLQEYSKVLTLPLQDLVYSLAIAKTIIQHHGILISVNEAAKIAEKFKEVSHITGGKYANIFAEATKSLHKNYKIEIDTNLTVSLESFLETVKDQPYMAKKETVDRIYGRDNLIIEVYEGSEMLGRVRLGTFTTLLEMQKYKEGVSVDDIYYGIGMSGAGAAELGSGANALRVFGLTIPIDALLEPHLTKLSMPIYPLKSDIDYASTKFKVNPERIADLSVKYDVYNSIFTGNKGS